MNAKGLLNLKLRPAKVAEDDRSLFAVLVRVMIGASANFKLVMFAPFHNHEIARVVIRPIAVDMMNDFILLKRTANHLLRDKAMLIKTSVAVTRNKAIAAPGNMAAFPIGMILSIQALYFSLSEVGLLQLVQSRLAQSLVTKRLVFGGGHPVGCPKVGRADLHTTHKSAQFTRDCVFHKDIIQPSCKLCNLTE